MIKLLIIEVNDLLQIFNYLYNKKRAETIVEILLMIGVRVGLSLIKLNGLDFKIVRKFIYF